MSCGGTCGDDGDKRVAVLSAAGPATTSDEGPLLLIDLTEFRMEECGCDVKQISNPSMLWVP